MGGSRSCALAMVARLTMDAKIAIRSAASWNLCMAGVLSQQLWYKNRMTKQEIILANQRYLFPSVFHYFKEPLVIARAKDQFVWDADGNQYLDFFGGIVTISVGHCNQTVNQKVAEQMNKLQHVSTVFANEPQAALAERIAGLTP